MPGVCAWYSATKSASSGLVAMEEINRRVVMVRGFKC